MRVIGFTDEQTHCDRCGKLELRGTVIVASEDADGNVMSEFGRYGTTCASYMVGHTVNRQGAQNTEWVRRSIVADALREARQLVARNEFRRANRVVTQLELDGRVYRLDEQQAIQRIRNAGRAARGRPEVPLPTA